MANPAIRFDNKTSLDNHVDTADSWNPHLKVKGESGILDQQAKLGFGSGLRSAIKARRYATESCWRDVENPLNFGA